MFMVQPLCAVCGYHARQTVKAMMRRRTTSINMDEIRDKIAGLGKQLLHSANRETRADIIQENTLKNLGLQGRKNCN